MDEVTQTKVERHRDAKMIISSQLFNDLYKEHYDRAVHLSLTETTVEKREAWRNCALGLKDFLNALNKIGTLS